VIEFAIEPGFLLLLAVSEGCEVGRTRHLIGLRLGRALARPIAKRTIRTTDDKSAQTKETGDGPHGPASTTEQRRASRSRPSKVRGKLR
jgi:hypothetical protein